MGHMNGNDVNKDSATPNREMPNEETKEERWE